MSSGYSIVSVERGSRASLCCAGINLTRHEAITRKQLQQLLVRSSIIGNNFSDDRVHGRRRTDFVDNGWVAAHQRSVQRHGTGGRHSHLAHDRRRCGRQSAGVQRDCAVSAASPVLQRVHRVTVHHRPRLQRLRHAVLRRHLRPPRLALFRPGLSLAHLLRHGRHRFLVRLWSADASAVFDGAIVKDGGALQKADWLQFCCRWISPSFVIVSSSLHIALIAASRYHVIVRPRFYARWLSSGVAVVSQIVFAWVVAAAVTLPGAVGLLPTVIAYSDLLSRCNFDRQPSYGALSVVFCGGFIVPCLVIGYCYGMIWRHTREVGRRVDGYSACRLLESRQRRQNGGESAAFCNPPSVTVAPSNHCVSAPEMARPETLLNVGNDRQRAREDVKNSDVRRTRSKQSSKRNRKTVCSRGSTANFVSRLPPVVVDSQRVTTVVSHHPPCVIHVSDDVALPQDAASTAVRLSCSSSAELRNNATCPKNDFDNTELQKHAAGICEIQPPSNSSGDRQPTTSPRSASGISSPSEHSTNITRSRANNATEQETGLSEDCLRHRNDYRHVADKDKELKHAPGENQTRERASITVVITPATTSTSAVTVVRESPTADAASDGTGRDLQQRLTKVDDGARLSLPVTRRHGSLPTEQQNVASLTSPIDRGEVSCRRAPAAGGGCHHRHRSHSLHMILAVFFAFVLTYLPFTVINLADQRASLDRNVYMLTSLAFWAGSCVNPLIYGIMNAQFRRAYVSIVVNAWQHSVAWWRRSR